VATRGLTLANGGHVPPVMIHNDGIAEKLKVPKVRGLGGRAAPEPAERSTTLGAGDRLIMVSDGVVAEGKKKAGLGINGLLRAAQRSQSATAPDTVREIHSAVLDATGGELDDATAVCLAITQP
jgi:sigma-B regulation protein RsbU (phosphoserine phosphatase)